MTHPTARQSRPDAPEKDVSGRDWTRRAADLFDPSAPAEGPPPTGFYSFCRWALRGAGPVFMLAMLAKACWRALLCPNSVYVQNRYFDKPSLN